MLSFFVVVCLFGTLLSFYLFRSSILKSCNLHRTKARRAGLVLVSRGRRLVLRGARVARRRKVRGG